MQTDGNILIFILLLIATLIVVIFILQKSEGKGQSINFKRAISILLIVAGILIGSNIMLGYLLVGAGVILAMWDINNNMKDKDNNQ